MTQVPLSKLLVICGPTASGKSNLAVQLAQQLNGEIINADSMQVYKGMDIGTAKLPHDQRGGIPHHLIDVAEPDQLFSAADFVEAADAAISDIASRGKLPIVVGGTGLYIRALLYGLVDSPSGAGAVRARLQHEASVIGNIAMLEKLRAIDPELAAQIHPNNLVRIIRGLEVYYLTGLPLSNYQRQHGFNNKRYNALQIGIKIEREELYNRIELRVNNMLADGLVEEVRQLFSKGYRSNLKSMRSIGYKEICAFLEGELTLDEALILIKRDTRRYAKRQLTWFNSNREIIWLEYPKNFAKILSHACDFFE